MTNQYYAAMHVGPKKAKRSKVPFVLSLFLLLTAYRCAVIAAGLQFAARFPRSPITLTVDASEVHERRIQARLVIPAQAGRLTLFYPKWIPGTHAPDGPIRRLGGLKLTAAGKPIAWQRDPLDMYTFHCEVPPGAYRVEVELAYILTAFQDPLEVSAGVVASPHLAIINWNSLLLYPKGTLADEQSCLASLRLPKGWKYGTGLEIAKNSDDTIEFQPVPLSRLVDSPVIAGEFFRTIPLGGEQIPHQIDLAAEDAKALELSLEFIANMKRLVAESGALFGARHYRAFRFLLGLSDRVPAFGLEHHECSVNTASPKALTGDARAKWWLTFLLPHEYLHSWNGKYRRPAAMVGRDFQQPQQTDLLWVYEGLTQYLGLVLDARSGLWTPEQFREELGLIAADLDRRRGRAWRPLADTAVAAQVPAMASQHTWRGGSDYYYEGVLIWLEADVLIRQKSKGKRSLDDFCQKFFGGEGRQPIKPYTFDDVVSALNDMAPHDWRAYFNSRLSSTSPTAPLGGIEDGGWRLTYNDVLPETLKARGLLDQSYSLGVWLTKDGTVTEVIPGMPAAKAGLRSGMKLIAINGKRFSEERLREAVKATRTAVAPLNFLMENGDEFKTYTVAYRGGEKYPHLERAQDRPDLLSKILKPLAASSSRDSGK
jgi:predicted metalloprotease with PDZ domain